MTMTDDNYFWLLGWNNYGQGALYSNQVGTEAQAGWIAHQQYSARLALNAFYLWALS